VKTFLRGLRAGVPVGIGYLSVSFTFGIMAVSYGLAWWQALLISMSTVTSAGQLAGIGIMSCGGTYLELLVSQLTINLRYSFMSVSLSQKTDSKFKGIWRLLLGFFMTDEIFAVASSNKSVSRIYFFGLSVAPYIGWSGGTLFGALLGGVLPTRIMSALGIAIYGMFVAIVVPDAKRERPVLIASIFAIALSCTFYFAPVLKALPMGITISICAIVAAAACAILFPVKEEAAEEV
jgi:predicted branched-subunit amino acid permease